MWKRKKRQEIREFPSAIIFLTGFLAGSILPNILWKNVWSKNIISTFYLFSGIHNKVSEGNLLLYEIVKQRGIVLFLAMLSGFTIFGVPFSVLAMLLFGGWTGAVLTVSILEFGLYGGLVGMGILLPQYFLYFPAWLIVFSSVYHESRLIWKRHGALPERMAGYGVCMFSGSVLFLGGMLLEAYVNPRFLQLLLHYFPVF